MEPPPPRLSGAAGVLAATLAAGLALYALYWVVAVVQPQGYRLRFLLGCLVLTFILYPFRRGTPRTRVPVVDWLLVAVASAAIVWPLVDFDQFIYRATEPTVLDLVLGSALVVLVLEATRRTSGPVLHVHRARLPRVRMGRPLPGPGRPQRRRAPGLRARPDRRARST